MVAILAGRVAIKGLVAACLGIMIGTIGQGDSSGAYRMSSSEFTYLGDGLKLVIVGLAIFAIPEIVALLRRDKAISNAAQLILVSLIGLTIGLDLPVMAASAAIAAWIVLWVFGGRQDLVLEVKFREDLNYAQALDGLKKSLSEKGFVWVTVTKPKFKSMAEITLATNAQDGRGNLVAHLSAMQSDETFGILDWHLE